MQISNALSRLFKKAQQKADEIWRIMQELLEKLKISPMELQ